MRGKFIELTERELLCDRPIINMQCNAAHGQKWVECMFRILRKMNFVSVNLCVEIKF